MTLPAISASVLLIAVVASAQPSGGDSPADTSARSQRATGPIRFHTRRREEVKLKPRFTKQAIIREEASWDPANTAVIAIDMWAEHPCKRAMARAAELAVPMNAVLAAARARGVTIIHAPSGGIGFYEDPKYRARIAAAPRVKEPFKIEAWRYLDAKRERALPIDDSDGGCDDPVPPDRSVKIDRHIHPVIDVVAGDVVSASGSEIYRLFKHEGIENVVVMGIHTNMCVLGRPFGIRNLVDLGFNVVLARDLTDGLYDPRDRPYVSHEQGVQLIVEHIERYWCPTILGYDLMR